MKKALFGLVLIILFSSIAYALSVVLIDPPDRIVIRDRVNNINFKCNVSGASEAGLYTNISGNWQQTGNSIYRNQIPQDGVANFLVVNVQPGTYSWNCRAIGEQGIVLAPANFSFRFEFPRNDPPTCNGTFPTINLEKNGPKRTDVLNLNNYFSDPERDPLTFAFSGASNIIITLKNTGFIDIEPVPNRVATDQVYFRANDGSNSDVPCEPPNSMTVIINDPGGTNQTPQNTAPRINPAIPDQIMGSDVATWNLNLNNHAEDDQDSKSNLNWTVENTNDNIVKISINQISKKVTFEKIGEGEFTVTFVVTDSGGLEDTQDVKIKIGGSETAGGESSEDEVEVLPLKIESHTPGSSDPSIKLGDSLTFFINLNAEGAEITWYVDGEEVKNGVDLDNYEFKADRTGVFGVSVAVEKDGINDEYEWFVTVEEAGVEIGAAAESVCGNGVVDEGETCETCVEDAGCKEGEECTPEGCASKSSVSGFAIANVPLNAKIGVLAGVIVIVLVAIGVTRARNKKAAKNKSLTSFYGKQERGKKPEVGRVNIKEMIKEERASPSGVEPIIGFIQSGLASGDNERSIRKALKKSGWSRKHIKLAFKSIKK